ncbi:MAG: DUF4043 family protein [Planctomycetota bacterium]|nr:MAG: DUF4043 family protein [Planctomycetota bacterium]
MAFDLSLITSYEEMIQNNPQLRKELWSESVRIDARNRNVLKMFIGPEGSRKPICEKRELSAGGAQKVTFTTVAPVRMAGTMGEAELKSHTGKMEFGEFGVVVDMRRFAISHNQLLRFLRFNRGLTPAQLSYKLCVELWGRMEQDDLQIVPRNKALFAPDQPNVFYIGGGTSVDDIVLGDTFDTATIEQAANALEGQGCAPLATEEDVSGYEVPQYVVFGPKKFLYTLENESKFREAMLQAGVRGNDNPHWTGRFPAWKGNIIHRHPVVIDSANGRQGSPLAPLALLGQPLANGTATEVTGGGKYNADGSLTDPVLFDYFSYFPGFYWKTHTSESIPSDSNTYYAMIYNVSGSDRGKYEIVSYTASGNDGNKLTVTRELDEATYQQKTRLTVAGRYTNVHPTGSLVIPCNRWGVPIGYALHMGAEALFMAKGAIDAERIQHKDDFENDAGQAHVHGIGIQGIRGYAPYEDTLGRYPNYLLIVGAMDYPGLNLIDLPSAPTT